MPASTSEGLVIGYYPSSNKSLQIILGFRRIFAMTDDLLLSSFGSEPGKIRPYFLLNTGFS